MWVAQGIGKVPVLPSSLFPRNILDGVLVYLAMNRMAGL